MDGFTSWDACFRPNNDSLEHKGIPGMHWHVRRFQNLDGSLTAAGRARYGKDSTKNTSAKKMQKDFNNLDKGYANIAAEQRYNQKQTAKYARKGHAAEKKGKTEKGRKLIEKSLKFANKAALNDKQKKAVESLQWKIVGKAAQKGYTTTSKAVKRAGVDRRGRVAIGIGRQFGLAGGLLGAGYATRHTTVVDGQKVKITKRGNGGTNIVNYANANKLADEERRRQRAKAMAGVRR